jgi:hypothetical protein
MVFFVVSVVSVLANEVAVKLVGIKSIDLEVKAS